MVPASPSGPDGDLGIFAAGGEAGRLMAAMDWSTTPVGPVESWPASLRYAVRTVLVSRFPMVLTWGPEFTQFYNDGYAPLIGAHHPAIGDDIRETLSAAWDALGPPIAHAMTTLESSWFPALQLLLERAGYREETYFTVTHAPGLRGRRHGGRHARRLLRGDRADHRLASAAAAARARRRRGARERRGGDRRVHVPGAGRGPARRAVRGRLPRGRGRAAAPGRRGRLRRRPAAGGDRVRRRRGHRGDRPAGRHGRPVGRPRHRGGRPAAGRRPGRRAARRAGRRARARTWRSTRSTAPSTS